MISKFLPNRQHPIAAYLTAILLMPITPLICHAQNLGGTPAVNRAVQGQTAAQPEGAFLNLVNCVGNVISPVGSVLCVLMAVVSYTHGRSVTRWALF